MIFVLLLNFGIRLGNNGTEKLLETVSNLSGRIRELEEALRYECNLRPGETHPLLKDELPSNGNGSNSIVTTSASGELRTSLDDDASDDETDLTDTMGLLTLSENSSSLLIGAAGSEVRGSLREFIPR